MINPTQQFNVGIEYKLQTAPCRYCGQTLPLGLDGLCESCAMAKMAMEAS